MSCSTHSTLSFMQQPQQQHQPTRRSEGTFFPSAHFSSDGLLGAGVGAGGSMFIDSKLDAALDYSWSLPLGTFIAN